MHKEHSCTTETPQKITEISWKCHGKSRKITENHGKSRKITENHGKSRKGFVRPITEIVEALHSHIHFTDVYLHKVRASH